MGKKSQLKFRQQQDRLTIRTVLRKVVKPSNEESLEVKKIRLYSVFGKLKGKYSTITVLVSLKKF